MSDESVAQSEVPESAVGKIHTRKNQKYDTITPMKKMTQQKQEGYSPEEFSAAVDVLIDESMERLRKRLRSAWKKNAMKRRHGATV